MLEVTIGFLAGGSLGILVMGLLANATRLDRMQATRTVPHLPSA